MLRKLMLAILFLGLMSGLLVQAQNAADTIELVGTISAVDSNGHIVVNGQTVDLTGAEINAAIAVGELVKVEGAVQANAVILAREVQSPDANDLQNEDEVELVGIVESLDGTSLVVGGITIDLTGAEIAGTPAVGEIVKVHASFDANGLLVAREAEFGAAFIDDNDDDANEEDPRREGEFEIRGTLEDLGDGFIVVNGMTISTNGAEIKNVLVVGTLVKVHLSNQNGNLVAREVENARDENRNDDNGQDDRDEDRDRGSNSGPGNSNDDRSDDRVDDNSGPGNSDDDRNDDHVNDNSGSGSHDDEHDDNSGSGNHDDDVDDDHDDNSGRGSRGDDDDHDDDHGGNSGRGSHDDDDD